MVEKVTLVLTPELKKAYHQLPDHIQRKFDKQLKYLEQNPKHPSLEIHKFNSEWEFYVDIHYRCFFQRERNKIILLTIGTHKIVERYKRK